jgi:hypothetical protein
MLVFEFIILKFDLFGVWDLKFGIWIDEAYLTRIPEIIDINISLKCPNPKSLATSD